MAENNPALEQSKKWFREAKYGMMIHWGLYSLAAGEWRGRRTPKLGEWMQYDLRIPNEDYHRLAAAFDPIFFDADEYVDLALDAGMKYMIVTSKHHDGFAMYRSKVCPLNIVDAAPFGRDVIGELANSCAKKGLKFGVYYSQDLDWADPDGGGRKGRCGNWWDFDDEKKDFSRYCGRKMMPQVEELLTQYGELCAIWFDMPLTIRPDETDALYRLVKKYQPGCLVNSRIGNGWGDYTSTHDNEIPDDDKGTLLYESPATLNDTWGYKSWDENWKSAERVKEIRGHLNSRGINYLLNVGPDGLGRIPAPSKDILLAAKP